MKKISLTSLATVLITILFCSSVYSAFSQNRFERNNLNLADHLNYPFKEQHQEAFSRENRIEKVVNSVNFGIKLGMNLSNMNFNKGYSGSPVPLQPVWRTGFTFGLLMQIPLFDKLQLNQEYLYSRVGGEFQPFGASYAFDYISFPVSLKYPLFPNFSILAGSQFELLMQGKEFKGSQSSLVTKTTEERSIGWTAGISYQLTYKIGFNARFMHGLNQVGIFQRTGRREFKYELIQISTGFLF